MLTNPETNEANHDLANTPESARAKPPALNWEDPFMLENQLTEDERLVRDSARAYAEEKLAPIAPRVDDSDEISWDLVKMLADGGYLRLMVPEEYGGAGLGITEGCILLQEICASGAGTSGASPSLS